MWAHVTSLDRDEADYVRVLSGQRICQLYGFMLLYMILAAPVNWAALYGLHLLEAASAAIRGAETVGQPPAFRIAANRSALDLVIISAVLFVFARYSDFRASRAALPLAGAALIGNLWLLFGFLLTEGTQNFDVANSPETAAFFVIAYVDVALFVHGWFFWLAFDGQRRLRAMAPATARMLSEHPESPPSIPRILGVFANWPAALRYARWRVVTGLLMTVAGVANFMTYWRLAALWLYLAITPMLLVLMGREMAPVFEMLGEGRNLPLGLGLLLLGVAVYLIAGAIFFVGPWAMKRLGDMAIRAARAAMRRSLDAVQAADPRPPVLFLRSFLDDLVTLPDRRGVESKVLDGSNAGLTLDHLTLREATPYGPAVALGDPADPAPPYGVARGYFSHEDWKAAVAQLCDEASSIIIALDRTEGVNWEIGHLIGQGHLPKTLFLAPPAAAEEERAALLNGALAAAGQPPVPAGSLGFHIGADGRAEVFTAAQPSQYSYVVLIRRFLRR